MPYATVNGGTLYYTSTGEGVPIVFIHPPLLTSAVFAYQQRLLASNHRVITFDIRGHGRSAPSDQPLTYRLIVEDIRQLMAHLEISKVVVAGYSTGGSIALEALLTHPELFVGGILISAMSETSDIYLRSRIRLAIGLTIWRPLQRLLRLGMTWGNADNRTTFHNLRLTTRTSSQRSIRQLFAYSLHYRCTERLPEIQAPVLLMYGGKDRSFKRYRHILRHGLPNNQTVILHSEKHQLPTKAGLQTNDVIRRWMARLVSKNGLALSSAVQGLEYPAKALVAAQDIPGAENENRASP
ncbi:alpha/beta fold hydrolase [Paenibacillus daejeonensis]|uniref:alpha/beta fold hydrolase n=1 Tax=Paenibacillus daejeonensis TaxID=135193 RepID=UPI00037060C7|nr:alpha/beta hydrolase [Paenibacillus daejeonensis]